MGVVMKYGGSSVATTEKIKNIAEYIKSIYGAGDGIVIVVSAMGKTTNNLLALASEISKNPSRREVDALISTGENVTTAMLSIALGEIGVPAISLSGVQAGILTDEVFSRAFIKSIDTSRIRRELSLHRVVIVAGFQGFSVNGEITTLGRGGSDTTAVALAASLGFPCEIYTDVDAVCKIDPRLYENAKQVHEISYDEMMELSLQGAKVLETRCIELAKKYNVPLYLGRTLESNKSKGTHVMKKPNTYFEGINIGGLAVRDDFFLCTVKTQNRKLLCPVLDVIARNTISFEMISENEFEGDILLSFGSANADILKIVGLLSKIDGIEVVVEKEMSKFSLVGTGFATHTNVSNTLFSLLCENGIAFRKISTSEISISFVVDSVDKQRTIDCIAKKFDL